MLILDEWHVVSAQKWAAIVEDIILESETQMPSGQVANVRGWRRLVGGCGEIALVLDPAQPGDWVLLLLPLIQAEREIGFLVKRDDKILVHLIFIKCSAGKKIIQPFITVCRLPFCRLWSFLHSIHSFIHCIHSFSELWRDRGSFRSETQKGPEEKTFKGREKTRRLLTREHGGLRVGSLIVFKYVKGI